MTVEGSYPPGDLEALKQGRRANAGRKGTTRAHRSSRSWRRRGPPRIGGAGVVDRHHRPRRGPADAAAALQAEVDAYIAAFTDQRDEAGRRLVVRNGSHQPREVLTSAGAVEVTAPRVNDRRIDPDTGERQRFASAILPAWCRKSPKITEVLPLLYLHGLSSSDFGPALGQFRWSPRWPSSTPGSRSSTAATTRGASPDGRRPSDTTSPSRPGSFSSYPSLERPHRTAAGDVRVDRGRLQPTLAPLHPGLFDTLGV
jgi:hypothetical protein